MLLAIGFLSSLCIGLALGLLGGGGSILTVPLLLFVLHQDERSTITTSLLVVGITSAVAAISHARAGHVAWRMTASFAAASAVGALTGGRCAALLPADALVALFAVAMLASGLRSWTASSPADDDVVRPHASSWRIPIVGLAAGLLTGLVGAGGGFIVVPALTLLGRVPMRRAIGSSLVVIAINSLCGFVGHMADGSDVHLDASLIVVVTSAAICGSVIGSALAHRVSVHALRRGFAVFVAALAVLMLARALFTHAPAAVPTPQHVAAPPT